MYSTEASLAVLNAVEGAVSSREEISRASFTELSQIPLDDRAFFLEQFTVLTEFGVNLPGLVMSAVSFAHTTDAEVEAIYRILGVRPNTGRDREFRISLSSALALHPISPDAIKVFLEKSEIFGVVFTRVGEIFRLYESWVREQY